MTAAWRLAICAVAWAATMSAWVRAEESHEVRGVVIDELTQRPVPGAIVTINGQVLPVDAGGAFVYSGSVDSVSARAPGYLRSKVDVAPNGDAQLHLELTPFRPKAVYLSAFGITNAALREAAVQLQVTNGINALVIDVKGDRGVTPYQSKARDSDGATGHAVKAPHLTDFAELLSNLHRRGFYLIGRIVVFKDDPLASAHPQWAVHTTNGSLWRDREHLQWIDPFSSDAQNHNIALAEEAAQLGFDEIQFDYVRFPDAQGLRFMHPSTEASRTQAIDGFLRAAQSRLAPYNVFVAADIFGYVCWNTNDTAIGQQLELISTSVDYLSPMLYPSGFTWGIPDYPHPTATPGDIVRRSLANAVARSGLPSTRFRPWLQAFPDYAFDHRVFGAEEIRLQVDAAEAEGTDGWMLWNPHNHYDPAQLPEDADNGTGAVEPTTGNALERPAAARPPERPGRAKTDDD
ncbi:putative glycoside hydrolase [Dyella subtropica]|uniref:putative glycoside hydrolase n=1 Tax=Dyella subtropica TaxID=2992127 RepID=UPI00225BE16A|nr:putative glycoside hydrolase [Dyella subtropica]